MPAGSPLEMIWRSMAGSSWILPRDTSQTLPRGSGRYISSFLGFAPAEDPKVLALCIIYAPQGMYYGGIIAAPVVRSIFENVLPYLGIERTVTETPFGENRADGVD